MLKFVQENSLIKMVCSEITSKFSVTSNIWYVLNPWATILEWNQNRGAGFHFSGEGGQQRSERLSLDLAARTFETLPRSTLSQVGINGDYWSLSENAWQPNIQRQTDDVCGYTVIWGGLIRKHLGEYTDHFRYLTIASMYRYIWQEFRIRTTIRN
jgi:hypothetical protein